MSSYDYQREKFERVSLVLPKGAKEWLQRWAAIDNVSVNQYIIRAILEKEHLEEFPEKS